MRPASSSCSSMSRESSSPTSLPALSVGGPVIVRAVPGSEPDPNAELSLVPPDPDPEPAWFRCIRASFSVARGLYANTSSVDGRGMNGDTEYLSPAATAAIAGSIPPAPAPALTARRRRRTHTAATTKSATSPTAPPTAPPTTAPMLILRPPFVAPRPIAVTLAPADADEDDTCGAAIVVTSATDVTMPLTVVRVSTVVATEDGGGVLVDRPALEPVPGAGLDGLLDVGSAGLEEPGGVVPGELDGAGLAGSVLVGAAGAVLVLVLVLVLLGLDDVAAFAQCVNVSLLSVAWSCCAASRVYV